MWREWNIPVTLGFPMSQLNNRRYQKRTAGSYKWNMSLLSPAKCIILYVKLVHTLIKSWCLFKHLQNLFYIHPVSRSNFTTPMSELKVDLSKIWRRYLSARSETFAWESEYFLLKAAFPGCCRRVDVCVAWLETVFRGLFVVVVHLTFYFFYMWSWLLASQLTSWLERLSAVNKAKCREDSDKNLQVKPALFEIIC